MSNRSDDFNRADNSSSLGSPSDGGGAYTVVNTLGINSNQAYVASPVGKAIAVLEASAADVDVQLTVATVNSQFVVARYTDSDNYVVAVCNNFNVEIGKIEAGAYTNLSGTLVLAVSAGDVFKLECNGSALELFVNGVSKRTATSSFNSTATKHGFLIDNNSTTRIDDLSVTALAPPNGTTIAAGDWSSTSTWANAYVPGNGDNDLHVKHAITVSDSRTVGSSPGNANATKAINIDAAGKITVQNGGTLKVRGDVECTSTQSAPLTVQGGGVWEFDSSAAASPSTTKYTFRANGGTTSVLTFSGSANGGDSATKVLQTTGGSHAVVRSNSGGGNGYFTTNGTDKLNVSASYAEVTRIGDATNKAVDFEPSVGTANHAWDHCTFDACGEVYYGLSQPAANGQSFKYCRYVNSAGTRNLRLIGASPTGGALREVVGCSFDKSSDLSSSGLSVTGNYFADGYANDSGAAWTSFSGNFVRQTNHGASIAGVPLGVDASDVFLLADDQAFDNPHFLTPTASLTISNSIWEAVHATATDSGDCVLKDSGSVTVTLQNCIVLGKQDGDTTGMFANFGSSNVVNVYHCTSCVGYNAILTVGDYTTTTTVYANFKSNISWVDSGFPGGNSGPYHAVSVRQTADPSLDHQDSVDGAQCKNNAGINLQTGFAGRGFHVNCSVAPDATNLVLTGSASAFFVDPTRNFGKWAFTQGSTGATYADRVADGLTYLAADPSRIPDVPTYIRAGFAPIDSRLRNAGHDGATIGAVEGVWTVLTQPAQGGEGPVRRTRRPAGFAPGVTR